jgi:hypothetical protein
MDPKTTGNHSTTAATETTRCERRCTRHHTIVTVWLLLTLAACGGRQSTNHYEKAVSKQEQCCAQLADDGAQAACTARIVRVDDPEVAQTAENQATFHCVEKHFVCDPSTGAATQESSQKALDCVADLGQ